MQESKKMQKLRKDANLKKRCNQDSNKMQKKFEQERRDNDKRCNKKIHLYKDAENFNAQSVFFNWLFYEHYNLTINCKNALITWQSLKSIKLHLPITSSANEHHKSSSILLQFIAFSPFNVHFADHRF